MKKEINYLSMPYEEIKKAIKDKTTRDVLSAIDCSSKVEQKNGLTYLSWAWAWSIVKKIYPDATYRVVNYVSNSGFERPYIEDHDLGYLVETEITVNGETLGMRLPVMDGANKAQKSSTYTYEVTNRVWKDKKKVADGKIDKKVESATMFDINTAIMRCLVKNLAMIGLGIYIYSGEDLPQEIIVKKTLSEEDILKLKDNVDSGKYTKTKEEFLKTLETSHDISEEQLAKISEIFKPKTATKADADKKAVEAKTEKAPSRKKGDLKELAKLDLPKITNTTIDAIKAGLKEGTYRQTADQCIIALRAKYTVSQIQETIIRKLFPSDENVEAVNEMDNLINNLGK